MALPLMNFLASFALASIPNVVDRSQILTRCIVLCEQIVYWLDEFSGSVQKLLRSFCQEVALAQDALQRELDWLSEDAAGKPAEAIEPRVEWHKFQFVLEETRLLVWGEDWANFVDNFRVCFEKAMGGASFAIQLTWYGQLQIFREAVGKLGKFCNWPLGNLLMNADVALQV